MNQEIAAIDVRMLFGTKEIDPYPRPPLVYLIVPSGEINQVLGWAIPGRERRYWATAIILGQPFA
jgi:hypothetical protein